MLIRKLTAEQIHEAEEVLLNGTPDLYGEATPEEMNIMSAAEVDYALPDWEGKGVFLWEGFEAELREAGISLMWERAGDAEQARDEGDAHG